MANAVDTSLRLPQDEMADQRFVDSIRGLHLQEDRFTVDRRKPFQLNSNRTADLYPVRFHEIEVCEI